jgi:hypothetical protein
MSMLPQSLSRCTTLRESSIYFSPSGACPHYPRTSSLPLTRAVIVPSWLPMLPGITVTNRLRISLRLFSRPLAGAREWQGPNTSRTSYESRP